MKLKDTRIVISKDACYNERRAAAFISNYIRIVTGAPVPTVTDDEPARKNELIVGKTSREEGLNIVRSRDTLWKFRIIPHNGSLILTGLGVGSDPFKPYNSAYKHLDDGHIGTALAAYHFVEDVLGCDFVNEGYVTYPFDPEAEVSDCYAYDFTTERIASELPDITDGPLFCTLPVSSSTEWNMLGTIIKTKNGKFILIDGGLPGDAGHFVNVLTALAGGKKPAVSAWFFSHLHSDHFGTISAICENPELRGRFEVENFYHHLLPEECYTGLGREKLGPNAVTARDYMLHMDRFFDGCSVHELERGDVVEVDGISFECLRVPDEKDIALMNTNDTSVVLKMTAEGQTWMLLGDSEWVADNDLLRDSADRLKSDVVQMGHHGVGSVSRELYEKIGADACIWHIGPKFWYSDCGEGLNTHNTGTIRNRVWMHELGVKIENNIVVKDHLFVTKLPMKIK